MGTIQIKRGLSANLPASAAAGEILYTTDTKHFYVGNGENNALTEFASLADLLEIINSKSSDEHTHTSSDITDFVSSVDARITAQKGSANGIASLDSDGTIPISQIPSTFKEAEVVADITARDELKPFSGLHVLVLDATGDSTVESGGAEYIYNGTKYVKVSELNNLDAVISWTNITDRPDLAETFLDLSDTPDDFTNQAGKFLAVNSDATALEFTSTYTGSIDGGTF